MASQLERSKTATEMNLLSSRTHSTGLLFLLKAMKAIGKYLYIVF